MFGECCPSYNEYNYRSYQNNPYGSLPRLVVELLPITLSVPLVAKIYHAAPHMIVDIVLP